MSWDANDEPDLAGYNVYFGTNPGSYGNPEPVTTTSYTLSGLSDGVRYYFAVTALDTSGNESGFSDEVDQLISASPDTSPPVISSIITSSITTDSAQITWSTDELSDTQIEYGTSTAYGNMSTWNPSLTANHSQTLNGLLSATLYNYRVYSRDAAGNLKMSNNNTFTTESLVDTTAPSILSVTEGSISTSSATIAWTTNEAADAQVEYGPTTAYGNFSEVEAFATTHNINLSALDVNTTYQYRVLSRDIAGNLATSGNRSFQTLDVPDTTPPVISGITESGVTSTSVIITWSTDEGATSQVDYGLTAAYGPSESSTDLVTSHSLSLSGLLSSTTYNYRVKSSDAEGNETLSANGTFTTDENSGLIITNLNVGSGLVYEIVNNGFSDGAEAYIDQNDTFSAIPPNLSGSIYIKTANSDKNSSGEAFLTFNITEDVDVYVAHDDHISRPSWLLSGFSDTGDNIIVDQESLSLFKSTFSAGSVSIGGNTGLGNSPKMYVVIIDGVQNNPGDTTSPVLIDISAGSITETGAVITWSSDEAATSLVQFGVGNFGSTGPISTTLVTNHSVVLTGLSPSTSYQYRVVSRDAFDNTSISGTFSFTTQDIPVVPGPVLLNITASEVTDRNAKITWGTDKDATAQVSFGETPAYGMSTTENASLSISHTQILSGLQAETTYHYQVISADGAGNRSFSENQTFTTEAAPVVPPGDTTPPEPVDDFSVSSGFQKLMLSWTNPNDSDFRGVRIYYRTDRPPTGFDEPGTILLGDFIGSAGQNMNSTHVGLENNVTYFYAAASFDVQRNYQTATQTSATTFSPASKASSEEEPFTTGGCGMIKPGGGGNPPGPGQAAEMILMFGIILLLLFKKRLKANHRQIVKISF